MSDQYTRVTTGGSPLPKDSPVVGLLFGMPHNTDKGSVQILDAEDIPVDDPAAQVSLHKAVFPQHTVVGWYRVCKTTDAQPTAQDLITTQKLAKQFNNSGMLFCFSQVTTNKDTLPITLFELDNSSGDDEESVLIGLEDWKVETSEAEKIAVETVVRELPAQTPNHSAHATNTTTIADALACMKERLTVVIRFLQDTTAQTIPYNHVLMRQAQQLVCQLGPLLSTAPSAENATAEWMSHLAVASKTVQILQGYSDKFRMVRESRISGRDRHRRF